MQQKRPRHMFAMQQSWTGELFYNWLMSKSPIVSVLLFEGKVLITLADESFILITPDQLLSLGLVRHRLPEEFRLTSEH